MRIILTLLSFFLTSCASYMEDKIGEEFKSIQPDFTNIEPNNFTTAGAVYNGSGGLFASDRRANNLGDIITCLLYTSPSPRDLG